MSELFCEQLWFKQSVCKIENSGVLKNGIFSKYDMKIPSFDRSKYICTTCVTAIKRKRFQAAVPLIKCISVRCRPSG